jgi:hypothetical protein
MIKALSFRTAIARVVPVLPILTAFACGENNPVAVAIKGNSNQSLTVATGTRFTVTLQTIGPGEYSAPPAVSSGAVHFVDVSLVSPYVPAGPTQRFRFEATSSGKAIIVFQHTGENRAVEDTVNVR